jgi:DNA invertase Pin-like site-specific DNA recombinase
MSTEHQQYSIENQLAAIAQYAEEHLMEVVRTYTDGGRSGLTIQHREGLRQLIQDVENETANFSAILVYDVSRWGRFQDSDESAYYEYRCKRARIHIHYCAEQFANDGSISSAVLKAIKRAMAAEYSRELSVKVFAGKCRLAELGFRQGGPAGFGLRRLLVDQQRTPKFLLARGENKSIFTDRVILVPGPEEEVQIVREIFRLYTEDRLPPATIARRLNDRSVPGEYGRPWTRFMIYSMVNNPKYIGANVSNRTSCKLRGRFVRNPPELWVRCEGAFNPIIDAGTFKRAQEITADRARRYTDDELLERLAMLLQRKGRLSLRIIRENGDVPSAEVYQKRFGGLMGAYNRLGYRPKGAYDYLDLAAKLQRTANELLLAVIKELQISGATVKRRHGGQILRVNDALTVAVKLARYHPESERTYQWMLKFSPKLHADITVVARMQPDNETIRDYYVLPGIDTFAGHTRLVADNGFAFDVYRFDNLTVLRDLLRNVPLE